MFYNIDTCGQCYDTFFSVTYATMSLIPYDFYQGYADNGIIYNEKSFITSPTGPSVMKLFILH